MKALWAALVACLIASPAAFAHHSFAMFDMDTNITFRGTVLDYRWANPHVHVTLRVDPGPDVDPASVGTWDLEAAGSTVIMARQGWNRTTLKAGDQITVVVHPMKDGGKGASLFYMVRPDGTRMYTDIARPRSGS
jgi:hypothetical protein